MSVDLSSLSLISIRASQSPLLSLMDMWKSCCVLSFIIHLLHMHLVVVSTPATSINVLHLGADPLGISDCSSSFQNAWVTACSSVAPSIINVPHGTYLIRKAIIFSGNCKATISFNIYGTILAPSDYRVLGSFQSWITFHSVKGVSIYGGTLDARGSSLWSCKASADTRCPIGATSLEITNSEDVEIYGLSLLASQMFHIVVNQCRNVRIGKVNVKASGSSPNTDGIHVQLSSDVTIVGSTIQTGDDCVSIGPGTSNLWIENVACGPGHGISIGSLGKTMNEPGVQNVTVKSVTFTGTKNGVRIKSWSRPSNGFVRHVLFKQITMVDVENAIVVDQNYCPGSTNCPRQDSGVKITDVRYEDIHGTSTTPVAVRFDCSSKIPCTGIKMDNVKLSYGRGVASSSCLNVAGKPSGRKEPNSCL